MIVITMEKASSYNIKLNRKMFLEKPMIDHSLN